MSSNFRQSETPYKIHTLDTVDDYIDIELCHEIHTSERKSFRSCRRKWDWVYREQYYPRETAKPLEFGIAYHIAMETYYNPDTWSFPNDVKVERAISEFIKECERHRAKSIAAFGITPEGQQDYDERVELGRGMIQFYFNKISPQVDKGFKPVKVEVEFMIEIPHPDTGETIWCKCWKCKEKAHAFWTKHYTEHGMDSEWYLDPNDSVYWRGLPVVYAGRLDMLAQDENGDYWIYDWKTAASINENKEWLLLDDQIGSYVWALRRLGFNVRGFIYHEQLKGFPQTPQKNARVTKGRAFSVNKQQMTDFATFRATVAREDMEAWGAGAYDDYLAYLEHDGMKFHDRRQIYKSPDECDEIERNIGYEALDMVDPGLRVYPASGKFACMYCPFKTPCIEKNSRHDYVYALDSMFDRREHYYKVARQSTDKEVTL